MTDWNDYYMEEGLSAAQAEVERQLATASPLTNNAAPEQDDALLNPPPTMAREAYHGILFDIVKTACKTSEASPVAVAANFLATFSAMVGRVTFQHIGDGTCHARPFFLLVGRTGKARKGTSEFTVKRIFDAVEQLTSDEYPRMKRHEGGLSTGEGLGYVVRDKIDDEDASGTEDKRLLVIEPEFAGCMAAAQREKNTLSATIRTAWDGKDIAPLVKNATWCASRPHIVITGHITAPELIERMTDVDAQSGFLNRFVILHIVRAKLVPLPKPTPIEEIDRLAALVADCIRFALGESYTAGNSREIRMSHEAIALWCSEYPALTAEQPGLAGAMLVRIEIYCRLFAMVFALLDKSDVIEPQHIRAALAWVCYWRDSVLYIFATLAAKAEAERLNEASADVLEFIKQHPGCSRTELTTGFRNKLSGQQITVALNHLMNAAPPLVRYQQVPRPDGKPGKGRTLYWVR